LALKNEAQGIADLVQIKFKDQPTVKALFVFSKIESEMKAASNNTKEEEKQDVLT